MRLPSAVLRCGYRIGFLVNPASLAATNQGSARLAGFRHCCSSCCHQPLTSCITLSHACREQVVVSGRQEAAPSAASCSTAAAAAAEAHGCSPCCCSVVTCCSAAAVNSSLFTTSSRGLSVLKTQGTSLTSDSSCLLPPMSENTTLHGARGKRCCMPQLQLQAGAAAVPLPAGLTPAT